MLYFVDINLGSSPGSWAATAASYCPSRPGELPKLTATEYRNQGDGSPCTKVFHSTRQWSFVDMDTHLGPVRQGLWAARTVDQLPSSSLCRRQAHNRCHNSGEKVVIDITFCLGFLLNFYLLRGMPFNHHLNKFTCYVRFQSRLCQ